MWAMGVWRLPRRLDFYQILSDQLEGEFLLSHISTKRKRRRKRKKKKKKNK
jgi:hypothetical protein